MTTRILCFLFCFWLTLSTIQAASTSVVVKARHLVDVLEGKVLENAVVLVEGDKIKAVGRDVAVPDGAAVIDLGNAWVLPGLMIAIRM